jgi:hypothetical protein
VALRGASLGVDRGRLDRGATASQPPSRHRATSFPTHTFDTPYRSATAPCVCPASIASTITLFLAMQEA